MQPSSSESPSILPRLFLVVALREQLRKSFPLLQLMGNGRLPHEGWKIWGIERHRAASSFLEFLKSAHQKTEAAGMAETAKVIYENICDETGISVSTGKKLKAGPHDSWRKDFYKALGIEESELKFDCFDDLPFPTQLYINAIEKLKTGSVWKHLGALMGLEMAIPVEFRRIHQGLRSTPALREHFTERAGADNRRIRRNNLYIDHHMHHDYEQHAPELWDAVTRDLASLFPDRADRLRLTGHMDEGLKQILVYREVFYNLLYNITVERGFVPADFVERFPLYPLDDSDETPKPMV